MPTLRRSRRNSPVNAFEPRSYPCRHRSRQTTWTCKKAEIRAHLLNELSGRRALLLQTLWKNHRQQLLPLCPKSSSAVQGSQCVTFHDVLRFAVRSQATAIREPGGQRSKEVRQLVLAREAARQQGRQTQARFSQKDTAREKPKNTGELRAIVTCLEARTLLWRRLSPWLPK